MEKVLKLLHFGYSYDGMYPVSQRAAEWLYASNYTVFLLYPDDTEAMAESIRDIKEHDGMFGVEKDDWDGKITDLLKYEKMSEIMEENKCLEETM